MTKADPGSRPLLADDKRHIRKAALARRAALSETARIEASLEIADHVDALALPPGAEVAGFWPIRDEVDPRPLLDRLRQLGHPLSLPVVANPHLVFRRLERGAEMVDAGFGTIAPGPDMPEVDPHVLLMPLAAFDGSGGRIGYGKGHYDTAIAALEKREPVVRIGVAFAVQEVDHVPLEAHDMRMHGIVTEKGFRRFSGAENI